MIKSYKGKDLKFPINAYRISSHISFYGYVLEAYKVELVDYDTENSIWKFRYTGELFKNRARVSSISYSQIFEASDLEDFHFDLLSVKNKIEKLQLEFKRKIDGWLRENQSQLAKLTEDLKANSDDAQLLRKIADHLNELSFPELKDLYEK